MNSKQGTKNSAFAKAMADAARTMNSAFAKAMGVCAIAGFGNGARTQQEQ
jgi:hypothetical protein